MKGVSTVTLKSDAVTPNFKDTVLLLQYCRKIMGVVLQVPPEVRLFECFSRNLKSRYSGRILLSAIQYVACIERVKPIEGWAIKCCYILI